jgi:hypothetical protein
MTIRNKIPLVDADGETIDEFRARTFPTGYCSGCGRSADEHLVAATAKLVFEVACPNNEGGSR